MNKPNVLLFDIDNTLLDFSAGAMQAMEEIFRAAGLPYAPEMFAVFQVENDKLWARIERGELTIAGLRDVRWQTILARLGLEADGAAMEDAFRDRLHESAVPVAGAPEVLARLHGKYRLCAASNGPYAQQVNRLRRAGMLDAFERLFISGQMGAEKPSRVFFDRCLAQLPGVRPEQCLMIGDSLTADIRSDPRVVCMERTNARYLTPEQIPDPLDFASIDVSFISLKLIFPALYGLLRQGGEIACLIKPQFEAGREKVAKKGVVRDPAVHQEVLEHFLTHAKENHFTVLGITYSPIRGPEGNIEYLGYLKKCDEPDGSFDLPALVAESHSQLKD